MACWAAGGVGRCRQRYSCLGVDTVPQDLDAAEIAHYFTPVPEIETLLATRRSPELRLGLILHAGFLRMTGRFLPALDRVGPEVLAFAARGANVQTPQIATLRSIYRRPKTLFEHQRLAVEALGFREASDHNLRGLTAHLRRQAGIRSHRQELIEDACRWLHDRGFILPGRRVIADHAVAAENVFLRKLMHRIEKAVRQGAAEGGRIKPRSAISLN
ncbi:MAG: DUF4158 domain-containing protein [Burkholderiales bacterium]